MMAATGGNSSFADFKMMCASLISPHEGEVFPGFFCCFLLNLYNSSNPFPKLESGGSFPAIRPSLFKGKVIMQKGIFFPKHLTVTL
jgi:hypothetical protein